jgi:hypothetical protein
MLIQSEPTVPAGTRLLIQFPDIDGEEAALAKARKTFGAAKVAGAVVARGYMDGKRWVRYAGTTVFIPTVRGVSS